MYEDGGSIKAMKNACVISDGGKILPKRSSNTFYHVNNNANNRQQQQHQQSYIKRAPLRNSPPSNHTKYSIHGNISNQSSDENHSRISSSIQYYNSTNNAYKNDSLESSSLESNCDTEIIEYHSSNKYNQHYHASSKTIRKRGTSWDNSAKSSNKKSSNQIDKKRSSSIGVFCDPYCSEGITHHDERKETGYVTILKINDSSEIHVQRKEAKISSTKAGEYNAKRALETRVKNNLSTSIKESEHEEKNIIRTNNQINDSHRRLSSTISRESQPKLVKNNGSVVVKVRDDTINKTRNSLSVESERKHSTSDNYNKLKDITTSNSSTTDDIKNLHKNSRSKIYNCNSKIVDSTRDLKRTQSNVNRPTKSSSLKRHSSICSGDLELNPTRNNSQTFYKDRRSSVDKAIQCRASSSSSLRFRSLVSIIMELIDLQI